MIYRLRGLEIKSKEVKRQLDMTNLKKGKVYVVTLLGKAIRFKVLRRFGHIIDLKIKGIAGRKFKNVKNRR